MSEGRALFGRTWALSVGELDVSELDLSFSIEKSTKREPNTCEVRVHNLSPDSRAEIEGARGPRVVLRAGFEDDGDPPPVLFSGDARLQWTERDGTDFVTHVQARDGGRAYAEARVSRAYGPGVAVRDVLADAVDALEIGRGNLGEFSTAALRTGATRFEDGYVVDGPARGVINTILRGAGLRWSVQNGALQIMRIGQALQTEAVVLSPDSGLVESPTRVREGTERGKVTARCLLQPGLDPGRRVVLESRVISGEYEVRKVTYSGDTKGNDWHATLEMRPPR